MLFVAHTAAASDAVTQTVRPELSPPNISASVEALARDVAPSVVELVVTAYRPTDADGMGGARLALGRTVGSGVVIDNGRFIITNAPVVDGAERIDVLLTERRESEGPQLLAGAAARTLAGRVIGIAAEFDLALVGVDDALPALPLANYDRVRQGEMVFALGSPTGLRNSVSMGLVSAVARQADPDSPLVYMQTDAAINPGNSGGRRSTGAAKSLALIR